MDSHPTPQPLELQRLSGPHLLRPDRRLTLRKVEPIIHRGAWAAVSTRGNTRDFETIHRHLLQRHGFDLSRYKESYLCRRLLVRVRALRLAGLEEYAAYL